MSGVFGVYSKERRDIAADCYYGLFALQHRGQESCGIAVNDDGVMQCHKDLGLVNDVFGKSILDKLGKGVIGVGNVRYGTKITATRENSQPIVINHKKGAMAIAANSEIINAGSLCDEFESVGSIFHTVSDSELMAAVIIRERVNCNSIEEAVSAAMRRLTGAYSVVLMSPQKLIGFRDPKGFRPLAIGKTEDSWFLSSETCGLDAVGAEFVRDVKPGEIVIIDGDGVRTIDDHMHEEKEALCVFEYIYFARPDSIIDGTSVHEARKRAGALLAMAHHVDADVVIGVPDSGISAAMGYAQQSGIPYGLGFIKNKYIGRTFIQPEQSYREDRVRIKLNPVESVVKGKRVVMVDDSIVRGTTSERIVRLLRTAGATEVHVRSSAPPFNNMCYFGTDIDAQENLIAYKYPMEKIAEIIGADSVGYLDVQDIGKLVNTGSKGMCQGCFTGEYPLDITHCKKFDAHKSKVKISEQKNK